jgi:hypothetical protein
MSDSIRENGQVRRTVQLSTVQRVRAHTHTSLAHAYVLHRRVKQRARRVCAHRGRIAVVVAVALVWPGHHDKAARGGGSGPSTTCLEPKDSACFGAILRWDFEDTLLQARRVRALQDKLTGRRRRRDRFGRVVGGRCRNRGLFRVPARTRPHVL